MRLAKRKRLVNGPDPCGRKEAYRLRKRITSPARGVSLSRIYTGKGEEVSKGGISICSGFLIETCLLPLQAGAVVITPDSIVLADPRFLTSVRSSAPGGLQDFAESRNAGTISVENGSVSFDAELQPSPHMRGDASAPAVNGSGFAYGQMSYQFEIAGPAGTSVPVKFFASGSVTPALATTNYATLTLTDDQTGSRVLSRSACNTSTPGYCEGQGLELNPSFSISDNLVLLSGRIYDISLLLSVSAFNNGSGPDVQSGNIDPVITIDPSFSFANQFTLVFSPGVGNSALSANIPEPSTALILASGIAGVAIARSRRKRFKTA